MIIVNHFDKIISHEFVKELSADAIELFKKRKIDLKNIDFVPDPPFDEREYYIHSLGFSTVHFLALCQQLNLSIELLTNFNYKKGNSINRAAHLIYNIENYFIRFLSVNDRLLQLINASFHLLINESDVSPNVILRNYKVSRTKIPRIFKPIKKYVVKHQENRNVIVHRHSYLDPELRKIEIIYSTNYEEMKIKDRKTYKTFRAQYLSKYLKKKKMEFSKNNNELFKLLLPLFDELFKIFKKEKSRLSKVI